MTLTQTIAKSLAWGIALFLLCAGVMAYVWYVDTAQMVPGTDEQIMDIRDHAKGSPEWAMEKHADDCWRGTDAPKAEIPTTILFSGKDGFTRRISNPKMVHDAFAEALGLGEADFNFVALCK